MRERVGLRDACQRGRVRLLRAHRVKTFARPCGDGSRSDARYGELAPDIEPALVRCEGIDNVVDGRIARDVVPGAVVPAGEIVNDPVEVDETSPRVELAAVDELTGCVVVDFNESSPDVELAVVLREGVDGRNTPSIPGSDGTPGGAVPAAEVVTDVDAAAVLESSPDVELAVVDREDLDI